MHPQEVTRTRLKRHLVRNYFLRFHMGLLFSASTAAGIGTSKLLLTAGETRVFVRYPIAVIGSYLVFLGLIRLWLIYVARMQAPGVLSHLPDVLDLPDVDLPGGESSGSFPEAVKFGGGQAGGGGASDTFDVVEAQPVAPAKAGWSGGDWSLDLDDDTFWVVVVLIVLVAAILGSGMYLVYIAPELLPELALNALLASSFAQAAKRAEKKGWEDQSWMTGAIRATIIPLVVVLTVSVLLAYTVHRACPVAVRLMDVFNCPEQSF